MPDAGADGAEALDGVGGVDGDANQVENSRSAVEEVVGLAGAVHLDGEADEDDGEDHVEHAADKRWRLVHKGQVLLQLSKELLGDRLLAPEEREVIGKRREKDAEEEACSCGKSQVSIV